MVILLLCSTISNGLRVGSAGECVVRRLGGRCVWCVTLGESGGEEDGGAPVMGLAK